jgi:D-aminopeptidase
MICHDFKGGIGTASRRVAKADGGWTVGALVQANYGNRELLRIDGVPVGQAISLSEVPGAWAAVERVEIAAEAASTARRATAPGLAGRSGPGGGSIIIVLATDAPLLPHQCERLAQRASLGLARMGSIASHGSGDIFIAFATGNRDLSRAAGERDPRPTVDLRMVADRVITPLFQAAVEATEAAVVNALLAAETMTGRDGITAHALDHDRLLDVMAEFGHGPRALAG